MIKLLERWFNLPPTKDAPFIEDHHGEKFWIVWEIEEEAASLYVWYRGRFVGNVNLIFENDHSVTLADIVVFQSRELRNRGLGKAMLHEAIRLAKTYDAKHIWGFIQPHDGVTKEYLIAWYRKQGFNVYEAKPGIYHILLELL